MLFKSSVIEYTLGYRCLGWIKHDDPLLKERETVTQINGKCRQKMPRPGDEMEAQRSNTSTLTGKKLGGGAPGQKNTAAECKQWRILFPGKRAEGAKVPCPLFRIFVRVRYCIWRHSVICKSLHTCELWRYRVAWSRPLTADALQNLVLYLWAILLIHFNHFPHMFISRHFHKPEWIFDTPKDIP